MTGAGRILSKPVLAEEPTDDSDRPGQRLLPGSVPRASPYGRRRQSRAGSLWGMRA